MAAPLRLAPHRQSAEPTGIAIAWKRGQDSRAATVAAGFPVRSFRGIHRA
jgi:hypothetical protein